MAQFNNSHISTVPKARQKALSRCGVTRGFLFAKEKAHIWHEKYPCVTLCTFFQCLRSVQYSSAVNSTGPGWRGSIPGTESTRIQGKLTYCDIRTWAPYRRRQGLFQPPESHERKSYSLGGHCRSICTPKGHLSITHRRYFCVSEPGLWYLWGMHSTTGAESARKVFVHFYCVRGDAVLRIRFLALLREIGKAISVGHWSPLAVEITNHD